MPGSHETPRVSAIIPCYNGERYIVDAVRSVLAQTEPSVEAIVIDDRSPDSSIAVLGPLLADCRVRLIRHDENRGIAAARNTGVRASTAEFIGLLDQDDLWLPDKVRRQLEVFDAGPADLGLVFSPVETVDAGGRPLRVIEGVRPPPRLSEMSRTDTLRALYRGNFIPTASALVRRECFTTLGPLDETILGGADDFEFWLRLSTRYRMHRLDDPLAVRRIHDRNFSADTARMYGESMTYVERFGREFDELADLVEAKLAWMHARLGSHHRNEGRYADARASYRKSLSHAFDCRTAFLLAAAWLGPVGGWLFRMRRQRLAGRS